MSITPRNHAALSGQTFTDAEVALSAVGERKGIRCLLTINHRIDSEQTYIHAASELEELFIKRGFDPKRGDAVQIWAGTEEPGADMLGAS
ncbi:MAG TPA: hypothetical protein VMH91_00535 [Candidatus Paceibacterota bacterium]|nr:hypothetical protein [Candidatus Paceibacterota bacterium]